MLIYVKKFMKYFWRFIWLIPIIVYWVWNKDIISDNVRFIGKIDDIFVTFILSFLGYLYLMIIGVISPKRLSSWVLLLGIIGIVIPVIPAIIFIPLGLILMMFGK